ncbi:MAG: hypothetical protein ACO3A4_11430 [Silvanigrellaceae bacterium]
MLINLLKNSDWAFLLDFVSPSFFKVIPPMELIANATALAKRTRDPQLYTTAVSDMRRCLTDVIAGMNLVEGSMSHRGAVPISAVCDFSNCDSELKRQLADHIVEIYFAQILSGKTVLLDVRLSRFALEDSNLYWSPAPLLGVFSEKFQQAMADLYRGYYGGDPELMKNALKDIGLDWAYDVFIAHFGEGDQTEVRFSLAHFVRTFHDVFVRCKAQGKSLGGEFVQLGVLLGLMYESLESLGQPVNVRAAFLRVQASCG